MEIRNKRKRGNIIISDVKESILDFLKTRSISLQKYMEKNPDSNFYMIEKHITHSDIITAGKRNRKQGLDKNYLYYLSLEEMQEIEKNSKKKFEVAQQSNISVPDEFFTLLDIPKLTPREGMQKTIHEHILINKYVNKVYLVNDTLTYFNIEYTEKIFKKLRKNPESWDCSKYQYESKEDNDFTEIELRHAIHGLGTKEDVIFHKVRRSIFRNDLFVIIIEKRKDGTKNVFILLDKNPRFFTILNETNIKLEKYYSKELEKGETALLEKENYTEEKTRKNQQRWRDLLASEIMNFTTEENKVFCPFTYISVDYIGCGTLFRASHIKQFKESDLNESFDLNNGLLLCANADALFDKHLITINEKKELVFSFLIEQDELLKQKLLLNQPIFKMILNEDRMKYLKEHRDIFYEKENQRKK